MDKNKLYKQINTFKEELAQRYYKKGVKEVDEYFYYVSNSDALDKAKFIEHLIIDDYISSEYITILDLTFGSGNLTSHIVFDNNIKYDHIIYNDFNDTNTNQEIVNYVDDSHITHKDILQDIAYQGDEADLVIINPQIGRGTDGYIDGDILSQKEEDESQQDVLDKLGLVLNNFLDNDATVLFYGKKKDLQTILPNSHYIQYNSKLIDIFVISNELEKSLCFEKDGNDFVQCTNDAEAEEEIRSFDNIEIDICESYANLEENRAMKKQEIKEQYTNEPLGNLNFLHKNLLLKGVPGTGKSKTIDNIIENDLDMNGIRNNVLRINIHSASSNSDLMQGISISTDDKSNILYQEKRGAVLKHIFKAMFKPKQPFVLVLEEIQENSLNELIGDLIYLIEKDKRTKIQLEDDQELSYKELFGKVNPKHFVELPNLVEGSESNIKMIMPDNLYVFCTSNYRDDKKVIEDNLLRRFDVVEIYPQTQETLGESIFRSEEVSSFLSKLNDEILAKFEDETHPDRYLVGHANWLDITEEDNDENKKLFYTALLKVLIEFKEICEVDFEAYAKEIVESVCTDDALADRLKAYVDACDFEYKSYKEMVEKLQKEIYSFLK